VYSGEYSGVNNMKLVFHISAEGSEIKIHNFLSLLSSKYSRETKLHGTVVSIYVFCAK
jgi:hypothetical protein